MANEDTFHLGIKALIRNTEGKILVLHSNPAISTNEPDHWDLPGGRMQKGHGVEETLRREVEEEIGVKNVKINELFDTSIAKLRIHHEHGLILFTFLCSIDNHDAVRLTDDEHSEFGWFSPTEAAKLLSTKFSDEFVEKLARFPLSRE